MYSDVLGMSLCDICSKVATHVSYDVTVAAGGQSPLSAAAYCADHAPMRLSVMPVPTSVIHIDAETLATRFHETYERLAPEHGYKTRAASAVAWQLVPENNKQLMIAVAGEILAWLKSSGLFAG